MSIVGIARRNWALRLSIVLNVCVLLYVCAQFGGAGPWIEEPPTNWAAAPIQPDTTYELANNGTQKGAVASSSSSSSLTKDAASGTSGAAASRPLRLGPATTTPPPNGVPKVEVALDKSREREHPRNHTVFVSRFLVSALRKKYC